MRTGRGGPPGPTGEWRSPRSYGHCPRTAARELALQLVLRVERGVVAAHRHRRDHAVAAAVAHRGVAAREVAVDLDRVPPPGVADVTERHVVMLTPEERHRPL